MNEKKRQRLVCNIKKWRFHVIGFELDVLLKKLEKRKKYSLSSDDKVLLRESGSAYKFRKIIMLLEK